VCVCERVTLTYPEDGKARTGASSLVNVSSARTVTGVLVSLMAANKPSGACFFG
jgi:hypothetical protein